MQKMQICCLVINLVVLNNRAHLEGSRIKDKIMSNISFYDHVLNQYLVKSRLPSWEARLINYRKWIRDNDRFTWPMTKN